MSNDSQLKIAFEWGAQQALAQAGYKSIDEVTKTAMELGLVTKTALDSSTLLSGIPGMGPALGGLNAAARDDHMGSGAMTGIGAGLGQMGGAALGGHLSGMVDNEKLKVLMMLLGTAGGGMLGGAAGRGLGQAIGDTAADPTKPKKR